MLVLTRKAQESVVVEKSEGVESLLKVTVLEIQGGKVRLGFEAGADLTIHRLEVWERIRDSGRPPPAGSPPTPAAP